MKVFLPSILLILFSALPGCIDLSKSPHVDVHDLVSDLEKAKPLAEQGSAEDQYQLGVRYEHAFPQDHREAVSWYRLAAQQQHVGALYRLCVLSDKGRGIAQDYQEALRWCHLASDQGHGQAMFTIGQHFANGQGVLKDVVQAHQWYNLAAAHGYEAAAKWRDRLALDMTATQIAQAQFLARNWRPKPDDSPQE